MDAPDKELLQFIYQAPVGLCQAEIDGTIQFITPMGVQLLMPIAIDNELTNFFDVVECAAPEMRNAVIGFEKKRGKILTEYRCPITDKQGDVQKVLGVTILKLSPSKLAISISDVTALVEKEHEADFGQKMLNTIGQIVETYQGHADDRAAGDVDTSQMTDTADADPMYRVLVIDENENMIYSNSQPDFSSSAQSLDLHEQDLKTWILTAAQKGHVSREGPCRRKNGEYFWAQTMVTRLEAMDGHPPGYSIVVRETGNERARQYALAELASKDPLTGALNRRAFFNIARLGLNALHKKPHPYAVLMADLDHFKRLNDTFGHAAGDRALQAFADKAGSIIRKDDLLARFGGEEFVFFIMDVSAEAAMAKAERLRQMTSEMALEVDGQEMRFTVSIGMAVPADDPTNLSAVIEQADAALYTAKNSGRNRVAAATNPPPAAPSPQ